MVFTGTETNKFYYPEELQSYVLIIHTYHIISYLILVYIILVFVWRCGSLWPP